VCVYIYIYIASFSRVQIYQDGYTWLNVRTGCERQKEWPNCKKTG
jgi:hypothetical protein